MNREMERRELKRQLPLELARRLEGKSSQFGKTVFMKLAYLLQELYGVPLGYRFSLYTYGPYSAEVLADLEYAKLRKQVEVEYLGDPQGGFRITPSQKASGSYGQSEPIANYKHELNELVVHFGSFNARELELRTTSIFLWKRIRPRKPEDVSPLIETVRHLKPHFDENTIRLAVDSLVKEGVIKYFAGK
jgi:hypothetical protein